MYGITPGMLLLKKVNSVIELYQFIESDSLGSFFFCFLSCVNVHCLFDFLPSYVAVRV